MAGKSFDRKALQVQSAADRGFGRAVCSRKPKPPRVIWLSLLLTFFAAALFGNNAFASRKLVSHQGLEAHVPDSFACAKQVSVIVIGKAGTVFQGERRALQRLVGGVRATLGFECSGITDIVLLGQSGGETVWRGLVSEKNGWVLVDMPFAPAKATPKAVAAPKAPPIPKASATAGPNAASLPSFGGGPSSVRGMENEAELMMMLP